MISALQRGKKSVSVEYKRLVGLQKAINSRKPIMSERIEKRSVRLL